MAEKMLIDASHPEETRVVVVRGSRIEEFDFESQHKKQIRGNIYLAKVTRVEPSLQAAFVDYGGNRHGFLAFAEIHPDYYQIPLADRQALLLAEAEDARNDPDFESADEEPEAKPARKPAAAEARSEASADKNGKPRARRSRRGRKQSDDTTSSDESGEDDAAAEASADDSAAAGDTSGAAGADSTGAETSGDDDAGNDNGGDKPTTMSADVEAEEISEPVRQRGNKGRRSRNDDRDDASEEDNVESVGAEDAQEELPDRPVRKPRKQYRIQEVIKRRQILLVQVVKEERGNKGAALTTYLSLAGRYSVLMPNTARGGGISRKITNVVDRKRLKEIARELEVPKGMGVILRTAGANRTRVEIKRDFEYLMRLWENVRNLTLRSTSPCLVYEEGSLIKRSIRDLYNKDISEIVVSGEEGYREAKDFMKMLMPSHAKVVQPYRELMPIFARSGIDAQLDRMLQPQVTLKSGGYIIINQTEALVAIDVNSGRSTREHSIEDTALQTNLEAAEEVARQLRLRDLAGLIVIDFIDMEENRNNRAVEKRVKDCLKSDRARIQVGRISHFGLLEMSRQRIRASVLESTTQVCPHCAGTGLIRSESSVALHVIRGIEEYLLKNTTHNITVRTTADTALYMLNHKRETIMDLERRFGLAISFVADAGVAAQHFAIDRGMAVENPVSIEHITAASMNYVVEEDDDLDIVEEVDDEDVAAVEPAKAAAAETRTESRSEAPAAEDREDGQGRKRRRRRRRGGRRTEGDMESGPEGQTAQSGDDADSGDDDGDDEDTATDATATAAEGDDQRPAKRRRRGKRGGRRNREDERGTEGSDEAQASGDASDEADAGSSEADEAVEGGDAQAAIEGVDHTRSNARQEAAADLESPEIAIEVIEEVVTKPAKPAPRKRRTKAMIAAEAAEAEALAAAEAEAALASTGDLAAEAAAPVVTEDAAPAADKEAASQADVEEKASEPSKPAEAAPAAQKPVVTSSAEEPAADKPKKGGWWQKRGFF
ncbi:RNAse E [Hoeflea marina]|uniref:Ribonuclease E n=1 Tax=Hoeflea marina TaxID=274592 RepID=A0A317PTG6_9HYPH|nr:ribonuclease E/G [Hoeflea marina]PWW03526.1 RNAse E [Hoeflea marina]